MTTTTAPTLPTTSAAADRRLREIDHEAAQAEERLASALTVESVRAAEEELRNLKLEATLLERHRGAIRQSEVEAQIESEAAAAEARARLMAEFVTGPLATMVRAFESSWEGFDEARDAAIAAGAPDLLGRVTAEQLPQKRSWNRLVSSLDTCHLTVVELWQKMLDEALNLVGDTEPTTPARRWGRK